MNANAPLTESSILVVEDTQMMRLLMVRHLKQTGFTQVFEVDDGQKALDFLRSRAVDLVLLDINMPVLDGYAALKKMKHDEHLREIPVIMVTAVDKIESVAKCIEMGAQDYMPKLFNPILLNARIFSCLELQALRRRVRELEAAAN
jgi:DNA-binding response OmpR family regulator